MTTVHLHGILAKEFGKEMSFKVRRPKDVFQAIDANRRNFLNRVIDLAREGIHYNIIVDGRSIKEPEELNITKEVNKIDIIPAIIGSGKFAGAIMTIVGIVLMVVPGFQPIGAMLLGLGLQMLLAPKPKMERPESNISPMKESFSFSTKANLAQQGIPIPVGYGRLRVGSAIIQSSIKSFPQKYTQDIAMQMDKNSNAPTDQSLISSYINN